MEFVNAIFRCNIGYFCIRTVYDLNGFTNLNGLRVPTMTRCIQFEACVYEVLQIASVNYGVFANAISLADGVHVFHESILIFMFRVNHFATNTGFYIIQYSRTIAIWINHAVFQHISIYLLWLIFQWLFRRNAIVFGFRFACCLVYVISIIPVTATMTVGYECFACNIIRIVVLAITTTCNLGVRIHWFYSH